MLQTNEGLWDANEANLVQYYNELCDAKKRNDADANSSDDESEPEDWVAAENRSAEEEAWLTHNVLHP